MTFLLIVTDVQTAAVSTAYMVNLPRLRKAYQAFYKGSTVVSASIRLHRRRALFFRGFFNYYNHEHLHSGIGLMTPAVVHFGQAAKVTAARQQTPFAAHRAHPARFVRGAPKAPVLPPQAWINPPAIKTTRQDGSGGAFLASPIVEVPPVSGSRDQFSGSADLSDVELRALVAVH